MDCKRVIILPQTLFFSVTPLGAPLMPPNPQEFSTGDYVKVELELGVFRLMQDGHGGWSEHMATVSVWLYSSLAG